ncbi:MAG: hypothetical protein JNL70_16445 [Saprospiraceae bacterium]|nr:hypothetical protein [Saprospiraceae bacterium]
MSENNFNTPNQEENAEITKPQNTSWLLELGVQSWQAELVLSGLVITILFQLPDMFIHWVEPSIIQSGEIEATFLKFASMLFLMGIYSVVILFGIHLLLRGIWIALLGLHSVYPQGIDVTSKNGMGPKYWEKSKEEYPNLMQYNAELDANCSTIFSLATMIIIMVSSLSICILVFYQCIRYLVSVFPVIADNIIPIGIGVYLLFMILATLMQYLGKKYPDNPKIAKMVMQYGIAMSALFSLYVFRKPIGYITAISMSNNKSKYGWIIYGIVCVVMGFFGGKQIGKIDTFNYFETEKYFTFNNRPHQILDLNYENLMGKEALIYTPFIPSDVVTDEFLKVFIPTIAREKEHINLKSKRDIYSISELFKLKNAQLEAIEIDNLQAYKQFNRIFLNGVEYPNLDFQYHWHPQADDKGLLVYIPTDSCKIGKNILEIRKNYFSKDSVQKIVKIPFFFEKEK